MQHCENLDPNNERDLSAESVFLVSNAIPSQLAASITSLGRDTGVGQGTEKVREEVRARSGKSCSYFLFPPL